jgi:hypothetical protein
VTWIDWFAVATIALCALSGLRRGLIGTVLSLAGLVGGSVLGYRLAPHVVAGSLGLPSYVPLVPLAGALVGAAALMTAASLVSSMTRRSMRFVPPLRWLDSLGGMVAGALCGVVVVWALGAVALELPGHSSLRAQARASGVVRRLDALVSPGELLRSLGRIDHLPHAVTLLPAPTRAVLAAVQPSVIRVSADACGAAIAGSGWVAGFHLVVTAAHVVEGATEIRASGEPARIVALDPTDGIAVLDVPTLSDPPLPMAAPQRGAPVALVGFDASGHRTDRPGRIEATQPSPGRSPVGLALDGVVGVGDAGEPALDGTGAVVATVLAPAADGGRALGVPEPTVRAALAQARALRRVGPRAC